jgi:hypothetical protein
MSKSSTSFTKGNKGKPKGVKHQKTLVKEALGLQNWEGLKQYIETEGSTRLMEEMKKMKGRDLLYAMRYMTEFFKPKLRSIDAKVKANINLADEPITFE